MTTLYQMTQEAVEIEQELTAGDGELTPELEQRIDALLSDGADKMDAAAHILRRLEASAQECKREAARLTERRQSFENAHAALRWRMFLALKAAFSSKLKTTLNTFYVGRSAPRVEYTCSNLDALEVESPGYVHKSLNLMQVRQADKCGYLPPKVDRTEVEGTEYLGVR